MAAPYYAEKAQLYDAVLGDVLEGQLEKHWEEVLSIARRLFQERGTA